MEKLMHLFRDVFKNAIKWEAENEAARKKKEIAQYNRRMESTYFNIVYFCFDALFVELNDLETVIAIKNSREFKFKTNSLDLVYCITLLFYTPAISMIDPAIIASEKDVLQDLLNCIVSENAFEICSDLNSNTLPQIIINKVIHREKTLTIQVICGSSEAISSLFARFAAQKPQVTANDTDF